MGADRAFAPFELSDVPLDTGSLTASLADRGSGAFVSFEGRVRDTNQDRSVIGLEYEAYGRLSLKEGAAVVREAARGVTAARCVHRVGRLGVGDVAVWIGVIAPHRDEAFRACRFIIEEVKLRVPIWKKEHYRDGSSGWVGVPVPEATASLKRSPDSP